MAADRPSSQAGAHCGCGRPVESGHRYCPDCGSLVGHLDVDGSVDARRPPTTLLDPGLDDRADATDARADGMAGTGAGGVRGMGGRLDARPVRAEGSVQVERSGLLLRLVGAGLAVVVIGLAWSLFRQPTNEIVPDRDEAAAEDEADEDTDVDEDDRAETQVDRTTTTRRRSTTTRPDPATTGLVTAPDGSAGVLLGEETGLTLIVSDAGDIKLVDLDSGELRLFDGVRGIPAGVFGSTLVLDNADGGGGPKLFDLARPEDELIRLVTGPAFGQVAWIETDRVWVFRDSESRSELVAFDAAGAEIEVRDLDDDFVWGPFGQLGEGGLVNDVAGGLYRRQGDGFERVSSGYALATGVRLALVRECDEARRCQNLWYDTAAMEVIDLPAPQSLTTQGFLQIVGNDRWLVSFDWRAGRGELLDIATGASRREIDADNSFGPFGPQVVLSDDGRWLLEASDGDWVIVDLETDDEWPVVLPGNSWGPRGGILVELDIDLDPSP